MIGPMSQYSRQTLAMLRHGRKQTSSEEEKILMARCRHSRVPASDFTPRNNPAKPQYKRPCFYPRTGSWTRTNGPDTFRIFIYGMSSR